MTRVALPLTPAGPLKAESLQAGLDAMTELGVTLTWPEGWRARLEERHHYLAGTDESRARMLLDAIDHGPDAIWLTRGGYGCIRTLEAAQAQDMKLFERPPVPLWAFSDGTALLAAWDRAGWPAWHAPPATQFARLDEMSRARTRAAWHVDQVTPFEGLETLVAGHAEAPLAGGNLCVLASLVGTPWQARLRGRIVLLEDTGERAYKVDRLFTQLVYAGCFEGIAGLALGTFTHVTDDQSQAIDDFFARAAPSLGVPVIRGLPLGHDVGNAPVPFGEASGWRARLEAEPDGPARLSFVRA
jgi:muramoyltetrapeptide carboxypeptidase